MIWSTRNSKSISLSIYFSYLINILYAIKILQHNGIPAEDVKKLEEAGFVTVESLVYTPRKIVMSMTGIDEGKTDKILQEATKINTITGFKTAAEVHKIKGNNEITADVDIKKLEEAGFDRDEAVLYTPKMVITTTAEINEGKIDKVL